MQLFMPNLTPSKTDPGPYDDRIGPTVLVTALFFAILTNFYLKFKDAKF